VAQGISHDVFDGGGNPVSIALDIAGIRRRLPIEATVGAPRFERRILRHRGQYVATQHQIGFACGNALRPNRAMILRDAHMRTDRTVFLRHACHVKHRYRLAFYMGSHSQQGTHRDDARSANAIDEYVVGLVAGSQLRLCE